MSSSRSFHHAARLLAKAGHSVAGAAASHTDDVRASWFDAVPLDGGDVALIVGRDHGATPAQRAAFAKLCVAEAAPSEIVAALATRLGGALAAGRFDPRTRRLTYATTGDAVALLAVADGPTAVLPAGYTDGGPTDRVLTLPPRAIIAFSTQGPAAEEVLSDGIGDRTSAAAIVDLIAERIVGDRHATLALTAGIDPPHRFACALPAVPVTAPFVRASLRAFAQSTGLDADRLFALQTAVGEAVANSIEHAYGPASDGGVVRVSAQRGSGDLTVWIEDDGQWRLEGDSCETRGRGLPLMRALVDAVDIVSDGHSTTVRLTLLLDG